VLGGTPVKILERIDAPVTFSPDGKQLALVRANSPSQGESELVIANSDGSNERVLAMKASPDFFSPLFFTGPSWSPDGKLIATAVAHLGGPTRLIAVAVADGKETELSSTPWQFASRVQWLPDMSGLLVIGGDSPGVTQVWIVSYPDGVRRRITNDLNSYRAIGMAADGKNFSTVQMSGLVNIWVAPEGDATKAVQLPTGNIGFFGSAGNSVTWTPDRRLVFVSNESGLLDLWIMDADGTNRRQLTANAGQNSSPVVSRDGKFIVFSSNRGGVRGIWRMEIDGSNPKRLTTGPADNLPALSADDKWLFYSSTNGRFPTLWKVSTNGGTPIEIVKTVAIGPTVSPDGKYIAYLFPESSDASAPPNRFAIISIDGGEPLKVFPFQGSGTIAASVHWSSDSRSLLYTVNNNNVTNLWRQMVDGGDPTQVTEFKDSLMTGFAWSNDGKTLACTRGILLRDAVLISDAR
jgi:Tol biopolymer transport system component